MTIKNYRNQSLKRTSLLLTLLLLLGSISLYAQPRSNYYSTIDGLKKEQLKSALGTIIKNHTVRTYDQLKTDYRSVYVVPGTTEQVWDIFSIDEYTFSETDHWNREHVVPNSWWNGDKNGAYSDLFSVIPSDATANQRKSNYPPAELTNNVKYDSGRIKVGTPKSGMGGSYSLAFEPYDEFKGDFARIYFYVATCYNDINWDSNSNSPSEINKNTWPTLEPWLYKMLLRWHNLDPVSDMEKQINNAVEDIQGNRNPFIDYPVLADYIWDEDYYDSDFSLSSATLYTHIDGESGGGEDSGDDTGDDDAPVYAGIATYTIASATSVSISGTVPDGSSATFSNTYTSNKQQLTKGNAMELTLSGYDGKKITGITLSMRSNKSSGAGYLSVKASNTVLADIGSDNGIAFSDAVWHGAWSESFVDVTLSLVEPDYIIQDNQKVSIIINATANSLYCKSFTIEWEDADYSEPTVECESTLDIASAETDGTFNVTWTNAKDMGVDLYADADCQTPFTDNWLQVELDDDNNVYYVADANLTAESRTVYMQLYASDSGANTISKVVTITQATSDKYNFMLTWTDNTTREQYIPEGGSATLTETNLKSLEIKENIKNVKVTYVRKFGTYNLQPWFVPFDYVVPANSDLTFAEIWNAHVDETGKTDYFEYVIVSEGEIIPANTPYLVMLKEGSETGEKTFTATSPLYKTEPISIYCATTKHKYTFEGTYADVKLMENNFWYLRNGQMSYTNNSDLELHPYRWHMLMATRGGDAVDPNIMFGNDSQSIKFHNAFGDDLDVADDISVIMSESVREGAYDLMGRKVTSLVKGNVYIINGKKVLFR